MRRRRVRYIEVIALLIVSALYFGWRSLPHQNYGASHNDSFYVTRVVDGDTLQLSNGERIRLIGLDTPEVYYTDKLLGDARRSGEDIKTIQELGRKASAFTKGLCLDKKVKLEYDVEKRDRYGRLLAYVYLDDGTFVNAKILEEGYAQVMTVQPNVKYASLFLSLQREAREANRGLWKEE